MAEITIFNFFPGTSYLHTLDIRLKLLVMFIINLLTVKAGWIDLTLLSLPVILTIILIRLPVLSTAYESRYFLVFLGLVYLGHALKIQGWGFPWLAWDAEHYQLGLLVCWRFLLIYLYGILLTFTSRTMDINAAIQWLLKPLPFKHAARISLMVGLMLRFFPEILQQAANIREAQKSRCINQRRNPLSRLILFIIPLLHRIFSQTDQIVNAMVSRCYNDHRTPIELNCQKSDWIIFTWICAYLTLPAAIIFF